MTGLTGQRHENSVLFSLSNLEALAKPTPATAGPVLTNPGGTVSGAGVFAGAPDAGVPASEGSGLVDIRAMARSTVTHSAIGTAEESAPGDELPAFGAQFQSVAPVLLPVSPTRGGTPKWVWAVVGLAVLAVVGSLGLVLGNQRKTETSTQKLPAEASMTNKEKMASALSTKGPSTSNAVSQPGVQPSKDEKLQATSSATDEATTETKVVSNTPAALGPTALNAAAKTKKNPAPQKMAARKAVVRKRRPFGVRRRKSRRPCLVRNRPHV